MIENIKIKGQQYEIDESFKKYAIKRLEKLDRYLPKNHKKSAKVRVVVTEINKPHNNKYEIAATLEINGGEKTIAAKDECLNVYAGIDLIEEKLIGQMHRYKLQVIPHLRRLFKNPFKKVK